MWQTSFVATAVALGAEVDAALGALRPEDAATAQELVARLRAPHRATRAARLAEALRDVAVALEEAALR